MYQISKLFTFEAAHHLIGLPDGHQCGRDHGHSYRVELILRSEELDKYGFVVDYGDLDHFGAWLKRWFDHTDLNKSFAQPTAEKIAMHFFNQWTERLPQLYEVRVSETQKTWATYRPTEIHETISKTL